MTKHFLLWLFMFSHIPILGQSIYFSYDNSGNRIRRETISLKTRQQNLDSVKNSRTILSDNHSDYVVSVDEGQNSLSVVSMKSIDNSNRVRLYSTNGTLISERSFANNKVLFNIATLNSRVYLISIESGDERTTYKFTKK